MTVLRESKPVYISVSYNLAGLSHPTFSQELVPLFISPKLSNKANLEYAYVWQNLLNYRAHMHLSLSNDL